MAIQLQEHAVIAGRFRLNHPIGRGGMGSVWHATHLGLDIPCAVKFIEGDHARMPEAQTRFEREAKAAATLRSPHVVQILDHGVCEGTPYIAMELLEGEDLGKRLQREGKLSLRDTHGIVTQVCRALSKAHALGIVHRDLKPENIYLVSDDDREIAKVLDFGIAKRDQNTLHGGTTKTGAILGTPYYMSPEQAQGTKSVDYRSDLWSLAVIVYQCATGLLPFESEALGDLLMKIIIHPLPVPSQRAEVPLGFDAWWARAAARDPLLRFQSAKDLADSLGLVCGISHASGAMESSDIHGPVGVATQYRAIGTPTPPKGGSERPLAGTTGGSMVRPFTYGADSGVSLPKKSLPVGLIVAGCGLVAAAVVGGVIVAGRGKPEPTPSASAPYAVEPPTEKVPAAGAGVPAAESATLAPAASEPQLTPEAMSASTAAQAAKAPARSGKGPATPRPASSASKSPSPPKGDLGF
jgi:serine/threonine protein kinase